MREARLSKLVLNSVKPARVRQAHLQSVSEFMVRNSSCIRQPNFKSLAVEDLGLLFQITDEYFFDGLVGRAVERSSCPLRFRLSKRMTMTGGMTTQQRLVSNTRASDQHRATYEIAIATTPLFKSFRNQAVARVGGLVCHNRLEALQRIMQHEMIHLIELLLWNDSDCAKRRFKSIAGRLFGHRESNHQLLTPSEYSASTFGIRAGHWVRFLQKGVLQRGVVNRITKRATVLVPDQQGTRYNDGKRYRKYYVPLERLQPESDKRGARPG